MAKKIALVYLIIGILWVTFSSWILNKMAVRYNLTSDQLFHFGNLKGYIFVFVSFLLLFWYLHRLFNKRNNSEKQFRRLFEENPNPMWVFDTETLKFLAVNQATVEEYGYSAEELLQMTIKDIRPKETHKALDNRLEEDIQSYSKSGIWCHKRKNGDLFYVRIYSNATQYNGRKSRLVMAFDISAIISAEQKNKVLTNNLAKKERYLRSLIESQTTFLIRIDTKGKYTFANRSFCQKLNFLPDSLIGNSFKYALSPTEQVHLENITSECLKQPGKVIPVVIHLEKNGGGTILTEWEFVAIQEVNSKITELQGVGRDVTEKVESELKIKEYSNRINDILESITDGFYAIDKDWKFTYVNKEFERIFRCKREEIMGLPLWDIFPEALSLKLYSEYNRAMEEQIKVNFEEFYPKFNSWFKFSAYPAADGLTVYFQDITQEKLAQEKDFEDAQNLNALINNPSALIWSVNNRYELISANEPFLNQLEKVIGRRLQKGESVLNQGYEGEILNKWLNLYERALKGEFYTIVDTGYNVDHKLVYSEISFNPIRDREGNITGTGCFSRDITETKLHELRIQKQNEKLKEIAWIQSHEVRVPVANILGLIRAFNYENLNDPFNLEVLENLNIVTKSLDTIIRNIVDKTNAIEDHATHKHSLKLMPGDRIDTRDIPLDTL